MVLVGPKIDICDFTLGGTGWKISTLFYDGVAMKPRTIHVPFYILPKDTSKLVNGIISSTDANGEHHQYNGVSIARLLLEQSTCSGVGLTDWEKHTVLKFFTYRIEYIGQAFGKGGERTSAERLGQGHEKLQDVLAKVQDFNPNAAVAVLVMDAHTQGREAAFKISPENLEDISQYFERFMAEPDASLVEQSKLVTVAEAMLIRCFRPNCNKQYLDFPIKDAPAIVRELIAAGITHLGVEIDVRESFAYLHPPQSDRSPKQLLRFAINLETGEPETLDTTSPLSWRIY